MLQHKLQHTLEHSRQHSHTEHTFIYDHHKTEEREKGGWGENTKSGKRMKWQGCGKGRRKVKKKNNRRASGEQVGGEGEREGKSKHPTNSHDPTLPTSRIF